jgi:hypothetical protein
MKEIWHFPVVRKADRYGIHEVYCGDEGDLELRRGAGAFGG